MFKSMPALKSGFSSLQSQLAKIQKGLSLLFKQGQQRRALSLTFKILPNYLSQAYVEMFCQNLNIDKYISYINTRTNNKKQIGRIRKIFNQGIFSSFSLNSKNIGYLQAFLHWLTHECPTFNIYDNDYLLESLSCTRPDKWFYKQSDAQPRVFIYHHGPTNSGKSTSAVQELKNLDPQKKGIYMAPLRLLAWEYQQKLGNCTLITGQEKEFKHSNLVSCTIEAAPLGEQYEVAVIDEIQMIGDSTRGWAWTKAILAIKAKRVHLCGDERALSIISNLLESTGDKLEERRYSRLSKLILKRKPFRLQKIEEGDCLIDFSTNKLIQHRNRINTMIQRRLQQKKQAQNQENPKEVCNTRGNYTALVHGKLPPQCRKKQAYEFNSFQLPYLVATNAIGMGLNLNIKKIVFMDIERTVQGGVQEDLEDHQIQQIAGRAGRGTQTGYVQCANYGILRRVKKALSTVNQTYGIQLELEKDESEQNAFDDGIYGQQGFRGTRQFNKLLNRQMSEKEQHIKKVGFYFTTEYIKLMRLMLQELSRKQISTLQTLSYLIQNAQLGKSYFLQGNRQIQYLSKLLQNSQLQISDLLNFHMCLSMTKSAPKGQKGVHRRIRDTHKQFIQQFVALRRVSLPQFLLDDYQNNYKQYEYIDQIEDLQHYYGLLENYVWMWNKYDFVFWQIGLAQKIKERISEKISQLLNQNQFKPKSKKIRPTWNRDKFYVDKGRRDEDESRQIAREEGI